MAVPVEAAVRAVHLREVIKAVERMAAPDTQAAVEELKFITARNIQIPHRFSEAEIAGAHTMLLRFPQ